MYAISYYIPSGNLLHLAMEDMAIEIVSFPIKNGGSAHSHVSLQEDTYRCLYGRILIEYLTYSILVGFLSYN